MKQQIVLLFSVLLLSTFLASAHLHVPPQGPRQGEEKEVKVDDNAITRSYAELKEDMEKLKGSEACYENNDEECSIRRMIAEAHLDYIYTQHYKP